MDSQLIRNALSELDRQLEEIHEAVRQIEGTSNANASWEDPEGTLPHLLNRLYERLLVVLEAADLPETKSRLAHSWYALRKAGGIGKTKLLPGDYLES